MTFFSLDDIAARIKDYPGLLRDYLGISVYSNLLELDTFVNQSSSSKLSFPIPLDNNYFEIEDLPISKGLDILEANNIVVISGNAGMGKTRYAIELAKSYATKTDSKLFVIEERNQNVREILDYIDLTTPYLFLIDDANRTAVWDEAIEYYYHTSHPNIKFIATVRNYALDTVIDKCSKLKKLDKYKYQIRQRIL